MNGLESARLSFHGLLSPSVAAAILGAAAVGIFILYFKEHGKFGAPRRAMMAILRVAVVGTVLFLLLRPTLVGEKRAERPRGPVLLLDNSLSMTQKDQRLSAADRLRVALAEDRLAPDAAIADTAVQGEVPAGTTEDPSRAALVQAVLKNPRLKLLDGLTRSGPLRVQFFGQRVRALPEDAPPGAAGIEKELRNEETRTALADAIHELLARAEGDLPSAIVVMTDGRDNASRLTLEEAAEECARAKVPLHIYGVGSTEIGNLELKDFSAPDTICFDDIVAVPVRWRSRGFKQGAAEISLSVGGRVVARREVVLQEGEDFREVLTFTPRKGGSNQERTELSAAILYRGQETFTEDNSMKRPVTLVDRKVKILYVENAPRWEYKFLQTALLRDRRVDAKFLLAAGDRRALGAPPYLAAFPATRQELFAFDLLILGDVPRLFIGGEKLGWIRDFVKEGGSLVFVAGRSHAPGEYHASPLAEVLPVDFPPGKPPVNESERSQAYVPVLTRAGERSDMLMLADTPEESGRAWQQLPGFYWNSPSVKLRPGAAALLIHPRQKSGEQSIPILATHFYGKGQVLFMGTDETWRWRANGGEKTFGRFWGQVIYQMGLPHLIGTPRRVQLALERPENVMGRPGYVYARVLDQEFKPYSGERVLARLERLDAKPGEERYRNVPLDSVDGQPGEYRALLPNDAVGRFSLRIEEPALAALEYRVGLPPQHELQVAGMDADALREAARVAGGRFYREEDLHGLAKGLEPKKTTFVVRQETLLWNPAMLLVFIGLIAAEWIARKFSNLS